MIPGNIVTMRPCVPKEAVQEKRVGTFPNPYVTIYTCFAVDFTIHVVSDAFKGKVSHSENFDGGLLISFIDHYGTAQDDLHRSVGGVFPRTPCPVFED